jgi:hypothetical protein
MFCCCHHKDKSPQGDQDAGIQLQQIDEMEREAEQ